jgi:hypothetical protein
MPHVKAMNATSVKALSRIDVTETCIGSERTKLLEMSSRLRADQYHPIDAEPSSRLPELRLNW